MGAEPAPQVPDAKTQTRRAYRKGRYAEALRVGVGLTPYEAGVCECVTGDAAGAARRFQNELERERQNPDLLAGLACTFEKLGRTPEATKLYRKALIAFPAHGLSNLNLGYLLLIRGNAAGALLCLSRALEAPPPSAAIELAVPVFDPSGLPQSGDERTSTCCLLLGMALQETGRFEDSEACFDLAVRINPRNGAAYYSLVTGGRADDDLVRRMEEAYAQAEPGTADRGPLCFALAGALAERDECQRAMDLYDEGNRIALGDPNSHYDRQSFERSIDWMIETYTADRVEAMAAKGSTSEKPVLIVGMMRSGTTLVEQIVSSHPDVVAGDELVFCRDHLYRFMQPGTPAPSAAQAAALTSGYLALLDSIGQDAPRVTDKLPQNFAVLGLVHGLFPNARILCCQRDAAETCLSIYRASFRSRMSFVNDRGDIAFFYRQFERLMRHWVRVLPRDRLMEVRHADLVRDREATTRRLIEFCGLPWDEACLRPDLNRRTVKTASLWQVRQPVFTASPNRSRCFEPWLEEFREQLRAR